MSAHGQTTADNAYSSEPATQHTGKPGSISNKIGGLGDIIQGTGEIIRGHLPGAGDPDHGGKAAIRAVGREKAERGLDRIEGKSTATSANGHTPARDWERGGVRDGIGAAPTTAPQASTTAPRADTSAQKAREEAADVRHPAERDAAATAGAAAVGSHGPTQEQAADGLGAQRDTDVRQQVQASGTASSDRDKQPGTTADTLDHANVAARKYDRSAEAGPGFQGDTGVGRQVNWSASSDPEKPQETRTAVDTSDPANTAAGQGQPL